MIEVSHLTKRYGNHLALSDLSFTIPNGQIYGLLGPNGAGKSTTMNILTGCLAATSGEVRIDGVDIFEDPMAAKRHLGYLPEQPPVYMDRTPWEYLRFVARAKGVKNLAQEVDRVMDLTRSPMSVTGSSGTCPRATGSGWALPRPFWGTRTSSSWTSPP